MVIQDYHTDALMGRAGSAGSMGKASAAAAAFGHYGSSAGGVPGSAANASAAALAALPSSMDSLINPALNPYAAAVKNPYGSHYGSVTGSHQVLQQSLWYFLIPLSDEFQALVSRIKKRSSKALAYTVFLSFY